MSSLNMAGRGEAGGGDHRRSSKVLEGEAKRDFVGKIGSDPISAFPNPAASNLAWVSGHFAARPQLVPKNCVGIKICFYSPSSPSPPANQFSPFPTLHFTAASAQATPPPPRTGQ